mmetsp:Transcript_39423/g.82429  ORF Transcript_39423/g.82429 Transcript_39423/m.82429 type:complete len:89 (-) Transcript_39423:172-438(-)
MFGFHSSVIVATLLHTHSLSFHSILCLFGQGASHHSGVGSCNFTNSSSLKKFGSTNARMDMRIPIIAGKNIVIDGICLNPNNPNKHNT